MVMRFLCPNGHKIHCADHWAGKPARCPKCGVKFRIPELSEFEASGAADAESRALEPETSQPGAGSASPQNEDQIEFLCPNGHRLHGPRSLEGQPGQCPECGVKFRVPSSDETLDEKEDDAAQPEIDLVAAGDGNLSAANSGDTVVGLPEQEDSATRDHPGEKPLLGEMPTAVRVDDSGRLPPRAVAHPLAELFSRLWAERARGAVIELHLSDGQMIVPVRYAEAVSRGGLGVFASTDSDGTHTVTAVAWESVARIVVRKLRQLPDEFHD